MTRLRSAAVIGGALLSLGAGFATLSGGCAFGEDCDEGGCANGVAVVLPRVADAPGGVVTVEGCVNGRCDTQRREAREAHLYSDLVSMPVPEAEGDQVAVEVTVRDESGKVIAAAEGAARVQAVRPSEGCPECHIVRVQFRDGRLVPQS